MAPVVTPATAAGASTRLSASSAAYNPARVHHKAQPPIAAAGAVARRGRATEPANKQPRTPQASLVQLGTNLDRPTDESTPSPLSLTSCEDVEVPVLTERGLGDVALEAPAPSPAAVHPLSNDVQPLVAATEPPASAAATTAGTAAPVPGPYVFAAKAASAPAAAGQAVATSHVAATGSTFQPPAGTSPLQQLSMDVSPLTEAVVAAVIGRAPAAAERQHCHTAALGDISPSLQAASTQASHAAVPAAIARPPSTICSRSVASTSARHTPRAGQQQQNTVTIKPTTVVKDAAGAIDKILSRGVTAVVTALRQESEQATYSSINQAVKTLAVARQYVKDAASASEVTFLPFLRLDNSEQPDYHRFGFLVFRLLNGVGQELKAFDETDLNVSRKSDVHKMANAVMRVVLERGQAVMKAAGGEAIFVAVSAVVNASHRLIQKQEGGLMVAAAWITEDTKEALGRESKFLRLNVLRCEPNGPKSHVAPVLPAEAYC